MTEYVKDGIIVEGQRGPIILDYFVVVLVIFAFVISVGMALAAVVLFFQTTLAFSVQG